MEITLSPLTPTIGKTFINSLYELVDGERVKTCLQCGTCSGICPFGYIMKFPPGKMIGALRADIFDQVMKSDSVWMCVSCNACSAFCPSNIPITAALMTRAKEELLLAGNIPAELQTALENTQRYGNPLGEVTSQAGRLDYGLAAGGEHPGKDPPAGGCALVRGRLCLLPPPYAVSRKSAGQDSECPGSEIRHPGTGRVQRWGQPASGWRTWAYSK